MTARLALLLLFCAPALAIDPPVRGSVVKVVSKVTGTGKEARGSGLLFERSGKRYVVTSDHVAFHLAGGLADTQAVNSQTQDSLSLRFIAAEWGNGLALFEVQKETSPHAVMAYSDLKAAKSPEVGGQVSLFGYPFESAELVEESGAKMRDLTSAQNFFLFVPKLLEISTTVGEFGMSGGPAFSAQGFLGILSHQRILQGDENLLYAIPASVVSEWLDSYFKSPEKFLPTFSEPWWAQGLQQDGGLAITNDHALFAFRNFNGVYRSMATSLDSAVMILKDVATAPFVDKRHLWLALRAQVQKDLLRPIEFALMKRTGGSPDSPELLQFPSPVEIFRAAASPDVYLFGALLYRHEERYAKIQAAVKALRLDRDDLAKLPGAARLVSGISELDRLFTALPPTPTLAGTEGAAEFFTIPWISDFYYRALRLEHDEEWKTIAATQRDLASRAKTDLQSARQALDVVTLEGR